MDERSRGGVSKNRRSSGCLIIKKKLDGVGSSSGGRKMRDSKKEKKRLRLTGSDSFSNDEEFMEIHGRRGVTQGSSSAPVVYRRGVGNHGDFSSRINDFDDVGFDRSNLMRERGLKRSKLDVYDFDEYDDLSDVEGLGVRHFYGRETGDSDKRWAQAMKSTSGLELESGSNKGDIIYKRRNSFRGGASSEKIKGSDQRASKRRFEVKARHSVSIGKEKVGSGDEAIRLQGKNGVLKVKVKHKESVGQLKLRKSTQLERNNEVPRSQELKPKNVYSHNSSYSDRKLQKRPMGTGRADEDRQKKRKALLVESSEEGDEESEDSDPSPKLQSESVDVQPSMKRGSNGVPTVQSPERGQPIQSKEGKVKRGSGTEKQLLREKIRNMLVSAGWTIDYRPRRGRDYFDAVYVNPTGTAYWSIIKAYDALQKQLEEEGNSIKAAADDSSSFAPISEDILSKLTRQTKKKIEKELKRKKREELRGRKKKVLTGGNFEEDDSDTDSAGSGRHDEKLSSFIKRSSKSLKGSSKEAYRRDGGSPSSIMAERNKKSSSMSNSKFIHARKSKKIGRCTLLIRNSEKGPESESDGYVPYTGKRNLLSWLIDSGAVKLSEKVHYMNRRRSRILMEGWITRDGIHCGCCSKILTVSKFEIHAASKLRHPFQNMYVGSGLSLMQCQVEAWNRQDESLCNGFHKVDVDGDDPNDDTCAICGDGGNLICCDGCPSTFHQNCLGIQTLPSGDWHCPHCSCKFCGLADMGGAEANEEAEDTLLTCNLCEGKYHSSCMEEIDDALVISNCSGSFCGMKCRELFEHLEKLLGVKHELEAGLSWSLIHRTTLDSDPSVRRFPQKVEWNSKLAVALTVMDECFLPIIDRRSGINMIHNVLYNCGSNFTRLNYSSFYTAILERGDEIICAASIRIRGTQFAEMPFIGTRHIYRRQGMCRRLFSAIEVALRSLKVEKLIIPAISDLMETWTTVFGFNALGDSDKQEIKTLNMLAFPGTDMLLKKISPGQSNAKKNLAGLNSLEVGQHTSMVRDSTNRSDEVGASASALQNNDNVKDKLVTGVCLQDQVVTSPHFTSEGVCNEAKPLLHSVSASISNEMKSIVLNEGSQGIMGSPLLFDMKSSESAGDEKCHSSPDTTAEIQEIGKYLNDSPAKHDMEESSDPKLTQKASDTEVDMALSPPHVSVVGTSCSSLIIGSHASNGDTICSEYKVIADGEEHNLSDVIHNDVLTEKPMTDSSFKGNIQDSLEDGIDGVHELPAKVSDVSSSSPSFHVSIATDLDASHECKSVGFEMVGCQTKSVADGMSESFNASHGVVLREDPQPDSHDEDGNHANYNSVDVSSCQPVCHIPRENLSNNGETIGAMRPELDSCEGGSVEPLPDTEVHHDHDTGFEINNILPISSFSSNTSAQNIGIVGIEKPQLDSFGGANKPVSEGELHHARNNGGSNLSLDTSTENIEASPHNDDNRCHLSTSTDDGKQEISLLPVVNVDDQSTP